MAAIFMLILSAVALTAVSSSSPQRIVGGSMTNINEYPSAVILLYTADFSSYQQDCTGSVLNERSILTTSRCLEEEIASRWLVRMGSTLANSGGNVYNVRNIFLHPDYNSRTLVNDIAILHVSGFIIYSESIQPAFLAGASYNIPDDTIVQAVGWGSTSFQGPRSEQLRKVDLAIQNQSSCRSRYLPILRNITDDMICAGWNGGGRGQCQGDLGSPVYYNNLIVGIYSFSNGCGIGTFPSISTRVNRFLDFIIANA